MILRGEVSSNVNIKVGRAEEFEGGVTDPGQAGEGGDLGQGGGGGTNLLPCIK